MPFFPMYNTDPVIDNEFGALDNTTLQYLLEEQNKIVPTPTMNPNEAPKTEDTTTTSPVYIPTSNNNSSSSSSSSSSSGAAIVISNPPPAVSATPLTATVPQIIQPVTKAVKTAPIDTILFDDETVPIDTMADLIFENIGGQELINITRNDIINGQKISYQPIKNLSIIQQQYNPNNIVALQATSDKYFANFAIKLENKIPNEGNGPNGTNVYIDQETGDLVVETINMENDEQVEVNINVSGTIYEAVL